MAEFSPLQDSLQINMSELTRAFIDSLPPQLHDQIATIITVSYYTAILFLVILIVTLIRQIVKLFLDIKQTKLLKQIAQNTDDIARKITHRKK